MILYPDIEKELYYCTDYAPLPENLCALPLAELRELLTNVQQAAENAVMNSGTILEMALADDIIEIKKAIKAATEKAVKSGEITAVIFINCSKYPFIDWIMHRKKLFETRNIDTLKMFVGCRVLLAETGKGKPVVKCAAVIDDSMKVNSRETWKAVQKLCCIKRGSCYDMKPGTKQKYLYHLTDVQPVPVPFTLPETAVRHGRVWAEL